METGNSTAQATAATEFFDPAYANEPAWQFYLLLSLEGNLLNAAWFHTSKQLFTGFASYPINRSKFKESLDGLLLAHPFLKNGFRETIFTTDNRRFALMPGEMKPEAAKEAYRFLHKEREDERLAEAKLINLDARLLFHLNKQAEGALTSHYTNIRITHFFHPYLETCLNFLKHDENKTAAFAHLRTQYLDLVLVKDGKLQLANSFYIASKEDLAYYLLFCADKIGMDSEKDPLWMSGDVAPTDENWQILQTYWKALHTAQFPTHLKLASSLGHLPEQKFCNLANLLLCVS